MNTQVKLFREMRALNECAHGEPALTLVRNDRAFGLFLSQGVHGDSVSGRFFLDEVWYLRVYKEAWSYSDFDSLVLYHRRDVWVAQDLDSALFFPNPSAVPYHIIFITAEEFARLRCYRAEGLALPVFEAAQRHFGQLPGFSYKNKTLTSPDNYATARDAIPFSQYFVPAGEF